MSIALRDWAPDPNTSYPHSALPAELQAAHADASTVREKVTAAIEERRHRNSPPDLLHHYTDAAGLFGLAFGRELWFSDYRGTNDISEGRHVSNIVRDEMAQLSDPFRGQFSNLWNPPDPQLRSAYKMVESFDQRFIACFTENPDHLPQWIHYGANGHGYCVGIAASVLSDMRVDVPPSVPGTGTKAAVFRVEYDQEVQKQEVRAAIGLIHELFGHHAPILQINSAATTALGGLVASLILWVEKELALDYKNSHFASEMEWRCVIRMPLVAPTTSVRVRGTSLASYFSRPVTVKTIKAGPRADYAQFENVYYRHQFGTLQGTTISQSTIPLR